MPRSHGRLVKQDLASRQLSLLRYKHMYSKSIIIFFEILHTLHVVLHKSVFLKARKKVNDVFYAREILFPSTMED